MKIKKRKKEKERKQRKKENKERINQSSKILFHSNSSVKSI